MFSFVSPLAVSSAVCRREAKREQTKRECPRNVSIQRTLPKCLLCAGMGCLARCLVCNVFPYWIFRSECWLSPSSFIFLKFLALVGCTSYIGVHIALSLCVCVCVIFFLHVFTTLIRMHGPPALHVLAGRATDHCWLARSALRTVTPLGCLQTCMWNLWLNQPKMCFLFFSFSFFTIWCSIAPRWKIWTYELHDVSPSSSSKLFS